MKVLHVDTNVVSRVIYGIYAEYGKVAKMTIKWVKIHKYLVINIDCYSLSKAKFYMVNYIGKMFENILEYMKGESEKPDGQHLLDTAEYVTTLSQTNIYPLYNLVAQLLYLSRQAQPDIQLKISFLCTRVR